MLKIQNLSKYFDGLHAVNSLDISFNRNEITAIVGPNGSGKSTLINLITGYLKPTKGNIFFNDKSITGLPPHRIYSYGISRTFQIIRIFPSLSVKENIILAIEDSRKEKLWYCLTPFKHRNDYNQLILDYLKQVNLEQKIEDKAFSLSQGQRKLLEIIRTFATGNELFMFDEPTAGIHYDIQEKIINLFRKYIADGKTIIFIDHNIDIVEKIADRIIVLDKGCLIADGRPKEVLKMQKVIEVYFGKNENS